MRNNQFLIIFFFSINQLLCTVKTDCTNFKIVYKCRTADLITNCFNVSNQNEFVKTL